MTAGTRAIRNVRSPAVPHGGYLCHLARKPLAAARRRLKGCQPAPLVPGARHPVPPDSRAARCLFIRCAGLEDRDELLKAEPGTFFITPHYDSYPALLVRLSQVDQGEMTEPVTESRRLRAPKRMLAAYDAEHPPAP